MRTLIFFIFVFGHLSGSEDLSDRPYLAITIPKSGTHLLTKALRSLSTKPYCNLIAEPMFIWKFTPFFPPRMNIPVKNFLAKYPKKPGESYATHLNFSYLLGPFREENPEYATFINIRDLRDVLVSVVHFANFGYLKPFISKNASHSEKLLYLINTIDENSIWNIRRHAEEALVWMEDPSVTVIRFENLIGEKGGGCRKKQEEELTKIADALSLPLDGILINEISKNLWGSKGGTFRKGKIGEWKSYFTPTHKEAFKEKMGDLLIALGYEKDYNW